MEKGACHASRIAAVAVAESVRPTLADWSGPIEQPLWSLPAAPGLSRWLIVHNLSSAAADGLYHVEVLERRQGQQPWQFQRLAAHLALTEQALRAVSWRR